MKFILIFAFSLGINSSYAAGNEVYGSDHLHPSPESLLGRYLAESGAYSFARKFAINKTEGPARLVVTVSENSFPILQKYFSGPKFLHLFHEPLTRMVQVAYNEKRGTMGRLEDDFRYTQSGVNLLPIYLDAAEAQRVDLYLKLAENTQRKFDVANFPWLLLDPQGQPYTKPGNEHSMSEWFANLPIGAAFDETTRHNQYRLDKLNSDASKLVLQVWTVPFARQSLVQTLNLKPFDKRGFKTPGLIAISLLASASIERVPVFFRFVHDHREKLDPDFNTWIDLDYNPDND